MAVKPNRCLSSWLLDYVLPTFALLAAGFAILFIARFFDIDDQTGAKRALLLADARTPKSMFTLAYEILGRILHPWTDNLFFLRSAGFMLVGFGSLVFSLVTVSQIKDSAN